MTPRAGAIEHQFPADLSLVEIKSAAAGDPTHRFDAVGSAVVELELVAEKLMDADQRRRAKAQKTDCIRDPLLPACFDERLIEGDIFPAAAYPGRNHAKRSAA